MLDFFSSFEKAVKVVIWGRNWWNTESQSDIQIGIFAKLNSINSWERMIWKSKIKNLEFRMWQTGRIMF